MEKKESTLSRQGVEMFFLGYEEEERRYAICSWKKGQIEWSGYPPAEERARGTYEHLLQRTRRDGMGGVSTVGEEPAMNTGLRDRMRWEDSPMPYCLLNFRQIGSLFRVFDFCSILLHNAYRRRLNP